MAFEIRKKNSSDIWEHNWDDATSQDLILSDGYFRMVDNTFQLYGSSSGNIRYAHLSEIILYDETASGTPETFTDALTFVTRLKSLNYPYFYNRANNATGVDSVFGRIGNVVAELNDYSASLINNDSTVNGTTVKDALEYLEGLIAPSAGDMLKSTYDPNLIEGDVFSMGNMVETASAKILTSSERTQIANNTLKVSFTGFTNLSTDYGVNLAIVATSGNYSDLINTPDLSIYALTSDVQNVQNNLDALDLQAITDVGSTTDNNITTQALTSTGTRAGGDLVLSLGDYDESNTGARINVDIANEITTVVGDFRVSSIRISNNTEPIALGEIRSANLTADRVFQLPDQAGTFALTSDVSDYSEWADYSGTRAGSDLIVNIGDYDSTDTGMCIRYDLANSLITMGDVFANDTGFISRCDIPEERFKVGTFASGTGSYSYFSTTALGFFSHVSGFTQNFERATTLTGNRTLTLPDATGTVALVSDIFSGNYNDLTNKPTIPTSHSELTDIGTNTHAQIDSHISDSNIHFTQSSISITESQISDFGSYLSSGDNVSELNNDAGYINSTSGDWSGTFDGEEGGYYLNYNNFINTPTIPTSTSDLSNDSGFITESSTDTFTNKSGNISQWTNDAGYISGVSGDWTGTFDGQEGTYYLDYNNFTNTPTIPTATSDITNDSGFITDSSTDTLTNKSGSNSQWTNDEEYVKINFFQVQDSSGAGQSLTSATYVNVNSSVWGTAVTGTGFSWDGTELTVDNASDAIEFNVSIQGVTANNNRVELGVRLMEDTGGGFTELTEVTQYALRNNTQNEGNVTLVSFYTFNVSAGTKYKIQVNRVGVSCSIGTQGGTYFNAKRFSS